MLWFLNKLKHLFRPIWKCGMNKYKYEYIGNRRMRLAHRCIMERYLGRPLKTSEMVHHINGDKSDNRISNLMIVDHKHHAVEHGRWKHPAIKLCAVCRKKFVPPATHRRRAQTCSKDCGYALLSMINRNSDKPRSMYRAGAFPSEVANRRRDVRRKPRPS